MNLDRCSARGQVTPARGPPWRPAERAASGPQSPCSAIPPSWDLPRARFGQVVHLPRERPGDRIGASQLDMDFAILKDFGEFGILGPRPARTLGPSSLIYRRIRSGAAGGRGGDGRPSNPLPAYRQSACPPAAEYASSKSSKPEPRQSPPGWPPGSPWLELQSESGSEAEASAPCRSQGHSHRALLPPRKQDRAERMHVPALCESATLGGKSGSFHDELASGSSHSVRKGQTKPCKRRMRQRTSSSGEIKNSRR
jgi:hypothetical protein